MGRMCKKKCTKTDKIKMDFLHAHWRQILNAHFIHGSSDCESVGSHKSTHAAVTMMSGVPSAGRKPSDTSAALLTHTMQKERASERDDF